MKCPWWQLTKNKNLELDCYKEKAFGIKLSIRTVAEDHQGFELQISFWWTLVVTFYDSRHADKR